MRALPWEPNTYRDMPKMVAAELLKVRTRWMPYILLFIMVALLGLNLFGAYAQWVFPDPDYPEEQRQALQTFVWPWSFAPIFSTIQSIGAIFLAILVASSVGTEHGWGTVRQALVRGQTRRQYLEAKLIAIGLLGFIGLALAFAFGLLFSTIATVLADLPVTLDLPGGSLSPSDILLMGLRTTYGILVYVLLAFALAVIWRSSIAGIAGALVFIFVEAIVMGILAGIGGRAADFRDLFIGHNVNALLAENRIGGADYFSITPRPILSSLELPDPLQAALVLGGYCLIFLAISFWVFQRRDIHT